MLEHLVAALEKIALTNGHSRAQNSQCSWSAGGRRERLRCNGTVRTVILRLTVLSFVTVNSQ